MGERSATHPREATPIGGEKEDFEKKSKKGTLPGGLEPPTCRLTAERATYCAMEAILVIDGIGGCIYTE